MTCNVRLTLLFCICFLPSFWGCSLLIPQPPSYAPEAGSVIDGIDQQNRSVTTVNGLASATVTDQNGKTRYRLAWAAEKPDHLRLIVLFSGKPVETVLFDGKHLSITSHTGAHDPVKKRSGNPNLEKLISLPIRAARLIDLLSGNIPVMPHRSARLDKNPQGGFTLSLFKRNGTPAQVFQLDNDKQLLSCEFEDPKNMFCRMEFSRTVGKPFPLPRTVTIRYEDRSMDLRIDQINPNPVLSPDTFKM